MVNENIICNYCGGSDQRILFKAKENQFGIGHEFNIVICNHCDLVFTNPRPKESSISKYYQEGVYYTHLSINESYESSKMRWRIKETIMNVIYSKNKDEIVTIWEKLIKMVFNRFIAIIVPYKKYGVMLDVGCGNGIFLNMMKNNGWETYGVEISESCIREAKKNGLNVFKGKLDEANYENQKFDVIIANQVLEHVYDPLGFLIECKRILKDDGQLIIGVPNFNSYDAKLFNENWTALQVPTHLFHFTPKTLNNMLLKAGFKSTIKYQSILMQYSKQYIKNNLHNHFHGTGIVNQKEKKTNIAIKILIATKFILLKPFLFIFSIHKGNNFSINITSYSYKSNLL